MKILVWDSLLIIGVLINFREVDSSPPIHGEGSSRPSSYHHNPIPNWPPRTMHEFNRDFMVSLYAHDGVATPVGCRLLGEVRGIPVDTSKRDFNYFTRALYEDGIRWCVVYVREDGEVLGARLPPYDASMAYSANPRLLNPTNERWYLTFDGYEFEVKADPISGKPIDINLMPVNQRPEKEDYIRRYDAYVDEVTSCGMKFFVYRRGKVNGKADNTILAADLLEYKPQILPILFVNRERLIHTKRLPHRAPVS